MVSPATRRLAVQAVVETGHSKVAACRALSVPRSALYLNRKKQGIDKQSIIEMEIVKLSEANPRYGYRRVRALLRRAGHLVNAKRVQRVRRQAGLLVPRKRRKMRRLGPSDGVRRRAQRPDEVWSYDFVSDQTVDGKRLRIMTLLDEYTRQSVAIHVARSIRAADVITVVEAAIQRYGAPAYIRSDNGLEFIALELREWLSTNGIKTLYITPGSPWENGHIESFHDKLRGEFLDRELFGSVREARVLIEGWRVEYNHHRPHSALGYATPAEYAKALSVNGNTLTSEPPAARARKGQTLRPTACAF